MIFSGDREDSIAQRREVVTVASYYADGDFNGLWWGLDNMGQCSNHNVFQCETFIEVYINDSLIKKNVLYTKKKTTKHIAQNFRRVYSI